MKKKSKNVKSDRLITEENLRKIIYDELVQQYLIKEGMWDDVQQGAKKLASYVTKQFKSVAVTWAKLIADRISKVSEVPEEAKKILQVLKLAMQQTGESFQMDDALKSAKEFGKVGAQGVSIVQKDLEGPVHEKAKAAQVKSEGRYLSNIYTILSEHDLPNIEKLTLNEDLGASAVLGIGLAIMGGLPMLFKGLHKLAAALGAESSAQLFERAEHVTHHFEQKVVDFAMPFKLAYAVYLGLWKLGIKLTEGNEPLNEIEIKAEDEGKKAIVKCKGLVYKTLLIYFAIQGVAGALKAGASLLGFVEGSATTIKGVELARGAEEIANLVRAAAGGVAV